MKKLYGAGYEEKLSRVMKRLGVTQYNYDWTRQSCFIEFTYRGQTYRFEHSLEKAKAAGQPIGLVSDCFAQLVMSLEDIARMTERGIYELSSWIEGMRALPAPKEIEPCFAALGFDETPQSAEEIKKRFQRLAKVMHPDAGGTEAEFCALRSNYERAVQLIGDRAHEPN